MLVAYRTLEHGWLNAWLSQYSFRGLMTVIVTGFIPLSALPIVSKMVMWESSQWPGKNIKQSTQERMNRCTGSFNIIKILLKIALNTKTEVKLYR